MSILEICGKFILGSTTIIKKKKWYLEWRLRALAMPGKCSVTISTPYSRYFEIGRVLLHSYIRFLGTCYIILSDF